MQDTYGKRNKQEEPHLEQEEQPAATEEEPAEGGAAGESEQVEANEAE